MKICEETMDNFSISYPLNRLAPLERILFVDIETTGFTARTSGLYLIGCAYYLAGKWRTIQWMAENREQEADVLKAFFDFAKLYRYLIHFNGNNFDLPFITQKCELLSLPYSFDNFRGIDLYKRISPYRYFLKLPSCKQKALENFLGVTRKDAFTASELIGIYLDYVKNPSEFAENALFLHNAEDLKGMLEILPMLACYDLFNQPVKVRKAQANSYRDLNGCRRRELILLFHLDIPLPKPISANVNHCFFRGENTECSLKIPIYEEELKYFYSNYHDYYYLPDEDVALHKSVAGFVSREYRIPASAANCYTRKISSYLPQGELLFTPFFKREYKSQELFFELTDELKKNKAAFSAYAAHVLNMMVSTY